MNLEVVANCGVTMELHLKLHLKFSSLIEMIVG